MAYPELHRDPQANVAYLALRHIGPGESTRHVPVVDGDGNEILVIDLTAEGEVLGIEFLDAEHQIPKNLLG